MVDTSGHHTLQTRRKHSVRSDPITILQNVHRHAMLKTVKEIDSDHHPFHMWLTNIEVIYEGRLK